MLYVSLLDGPAVQHHLEHLLQVKEPYHKKYMYYSAYWVPVACTFAIVPLIPNIPLAYNLFRLYSHYTGKRRWWMDGYEGKERY